jgi:hypothetical protein
MAPAEPPATSTSVASFSDGRAGSAGADSWSSIAATISLPRNCQVASPILRWPSPAYASELQ